MPGLLSTLIIGLGTAISKGVFKAWLGDAPALESGASSISDLIASVTSNVLARRKLRREFEVIAESTADTIFEIIENDFEYINESRKIVVANSVTDLIEYGFTDFSLVMKSAMNPENLAKELISRRGRDFGNTGDNFSEQEKRLYVQLVSESSQIIIDLAQNIPGFNEVIASENLRKADDIEKICNAILDEVKKIRAVSDRGSDDDRTFESNYRRSVIRNNSSIQLFGINGSETSRRYDLNVAFVALEMNLDQKQGQVDGGVTIERALQLSDRIVIRGAAGSGKTTLLQWLSVNMANMSFGADMNNYNSYLPFFIKVRKYPSGPLPKLIDMVSEASELLAEGMPDNWVAKKLKEGKSVIMIDGLDEISTARRDQFRKWIDELISLYPNNIYIVTMRPYALPPGWLKNLSFTETSILDLDLKRIKEFIEHWHNSVERSCTTNSEIATLRACKENLLEVVVYQRVLFRLSRSPLLCALLCVLNRGRSGKLPRRKVDIYRECISLFFRREMERAINPLKIDLDEPQLISVVSDLALWMLRNGLAQCSLEEALTRLDVSIGRLNLEDRPTSKLMLRYLVERSGILRIPQADTVDFPHKTFLEYFSALAITLEGGIGELISRAQDDRWREIVVLSGSLLGQSHAEKLVDGIFQKGEDDPTALIIAAATLESVLALPEGSEVPGRIQAGLEKLIPPANMPAAHSLSAAGNYLVPYLRYNPRERIQHLLCIEVLKKVGTDEAYQVLKEYLKTDDHEVKDALIKAYEDYSVPIAKDAIHVKSLEKIEVIIRSLASHQVRYYFDDELTLLETSNVPPSWWEEVDLKCENVEVSGETIESVTDVDFAKVSKVLSAPLGVKLKAVIYSLAAKEAGLQDSEVLHTVVQKYQAAMSEGTATHKLTPTTRLFVKFMSNNSLDPISTLNTVEKSEYFVLSPLVSDKVQEVKEFLIAYA
ncbi:NACHT domain-containing protein [Pseudomaricurvus alkylphenolicus]|uniref:NACHT domain-containing protein n=1 Tax=Pseudomaricurvus alkylphenolicus TaxID=1306991 RepID=UPI001423F50D|nr:NACHT domain-containing protein [Pseudomaricurvus alkylphenolicus]NIB44805.1 NACHT domain-containing protein [Pseudomaricurvus alkylphenolicus]